MDTSVSALVKDFLEKLVRDDAEFERLKALEQTTREQITNFRGGDRLSREELYERG